jgi:hypothetical protein
VFISFVAGLSLGYFWKGHIVKKVMLGLLAASLLAALSLIPYKYERYGDVRHLLPVSYPLHTEIQRFIIIMQIVPPPPSIKLTIYLVKVPIVVYWCYTASNAFLVSFAAFFVASLASLSVGTFLGGLIRYWRACHGKQAEVTA